MLKELEVYSWSFEVTFKSLIISNDDIKLLKKWIGIDFTPELLYRASKDGWSADDFHRLCDNKGPIIVVCKSNYDKVFGGKIFIF